MFDIKLFFQLHDFLIAKKCADVLSSLGFKIENLSDIQYLKCTEFSTHVKHASFPCDLFNISKLIGYRYEISRLPVVLH